jgi:hypothetical protein
MFFGQPPYPATTPVVFTHSNIPVKMTWATDLFGPTLLTKDGDKVVSKPTDEVVGGKKFIVLYFSAHVSLGVQLLHAEDFWNFKCKNCKPSCCCSYIHLQMLVPCSGAVHAENSLPCCLSAMRT